MSTFISGGSKSGKSMFAQRVAIRSGNPAYYIATMIPHDDEDLARIARHRQERLGWGFETVECGKDILSILEYTDNDGAFLLDSTTALLSNEMFAADGYHPDAGKKLAAELAEFVRRAPNSVIVSDQINNDAVRYDSWTLTYCSALAEVDRALAAACDNVIEVVCGLKICYKGVIPCE